MTPRWPSLLLVGNPEPTHVGAHLAAAAAELHVPVTLCDVSEAWRGPAWRRRLSWWALGHRPAALREFGAGVVATARAVRPDVVLTTGLAPLGRQAIEALGALGCHRVNYLTDDPWNPAHTAGWFLDALQKYDAVFSPRLANVADLEALDGPVVHYLPFAYNPAVHHPSPPLGEAERRQYEADVVFAGGADRDRAEVAGALVAAGLDVALYGGYWERFAATRNHARGHLDAEGLRKAIAGARVCLCLVRRANRDGQSMRTYEVAATGGCMLVERTAEHEALFGPDGRAVVYFASPREAVERTRELLARPDERERLATQARAVVTGGRHTYRDRLEQLLRTIAGCSNEDRLRHSRSLSRV